LGDYLNEATIKALSKATQDPVRLVRVRAAAELLALPQDNIPHDYHASLKTAIKEYENSLNTYPDQEASHFNLGHFHEEQQNYSDAARDYRRALQLRPEFTEASINLGMLYYQNGRLDSAMFYLKNAVQQEPEHAAANLNLGLLYAELGEWDNAIVALSTSFDLQKTAVAANNLAILFSKFSPLKALDYAKEAYDLQSSDPKYVYNYAFYLMDNAKTEKAVNILEKAIQNNVVSFDIYYLLGSLYRNSGEDDAYQKLKKVIEKDRSLSEDERNILLNK
jgi:tetratricopeptide (TPR) repeat protein